MKYFEHNRNQGQYICHYRNYNIDYVSEHLLSDAALVSCGLKSRFYFAQSLVCYFPSFRDWRERFANSLFRSKYQLLYYIFTLRSNCKYMVIISPFLALSMIFCRTFYIKKIEVISWFLGYFATSKQSQCSHTLTFLQGQFYQNSLPVSKASGYHIRKKSNCYTCLNFITSKHSKRVPV